MSEKLLVESVAGLFVLTVTIGAVIYVLARPRR